MKNPTSRITVKTKWLSIDAEVDDETAQTLATMLVNSLIEKANDKAKDEESKSVEQVTP